MYLLTYWSKFKYTPGKDVIAMRAYYTGRKVTKDITGTVIRASAYNGSLNKHIQRIYNLNIVLPETLYTEHQIPKHSGGFRTVYEPCDELRKIQQDIVKNIFDKSHCLAHNAVHSYLKHRSCKTALLEHQRNHAHWFLKMDIEHYFDNIKYEKLITYLYQLYPFCTLQDHIKEKLNVILKRYCFYNDKLPQGNITSPWISNLYLTQFDYMLSNQMKEQGFIYTRYADDLLISSKKCFVSSGVVSAVEDLLSTLYELHINTNKTRYGSSNGRNWNLGIMYNKDLQLTVGHNAKHKLKCMVYNMQKMDTASEEYRKLNMHVKGLLAYYQSIEPDYVASIKNYWNTKQYTI